MSLIIRLSEFTLVSQRILFPLFDFLKCRQFSDVCWIIFKDLFLNSKRGQDRRSDSADAEQFTGPLLGADEWSADLRAEGGTEGTFSHTSALSSLYSCHRDHEWSVSGKSSRGRRLRPTGSFLKAHDGDFVPFQCPSHQIGAAACLIGWSEFWCPNHLKTITFSRTETVTRPKTSMLKKCENIAPFVETEGPRLILMHFFLVK